MCMKKINAEKMMFDKITLLINSFVYGCPGKALFGNRPSRHNLRDLQLTVGKK